MSLSWYPADSADEGAPDEEVSLDGIAEGASWGYVAAESRSIQGTLTTRWSWGVLDSWLWDDADYLAQGEEATKEEARAALTSWVQTHPVPPSSLAGDPTVGEIAAHDAEQARREGERAWSEPTSYHVRDSGEPHGTSEARNSRGETKAEAWARYHEEHPEVLASWGEQNGRWPEPEDHRCGPCKVEGHNTCPMVHGCPCCEDTMIREAGGTP